MTVPVGDHLDPGNQIESADAITFLVPDPVETTRSLQSM